MHNVLNSDIPFLPTSDVQISRQPYFARSPHFWGSALKRRILKMHVLLVLVHGVPKTEYFYVFNESIKGDANINVEGLRRSLLKHVEPDEDGEARRLPSTLYAQIDSAGDNKNQWMLDFLGMLVLKKKVSSESRRSHP